LISIDIFQGSSFLAAGQWRVVPDKVTGTVPDKVTGTFLAFLYAFPTIFRPYRGNHAKTMVRGINYAYFLSMTWR